MKNSKFNLIVYSKKLLFLVDDILTCFPNKERVLKDKIKSTIYELLECIYEANALYVSEFKDKRYLLQIECISKINLLNTLIEEAYNYKYISEKDTRAVANYLDKLNIFTKGWMKSDISNH